MLKKPNWPLTVAPVLLVMVSTKRAALGTPALAKALVMAVGVAWLSRLDAQSSYWTGVLPPLCVFGVGLALMVAPLTGRIRIAFDADNPGRWAFHCHNLYHMMTGMMMEFRYHGIAA